MSSTATVWSITFTSTRTSRRGSNPPAPLGPGIYHQAYIFDQGRKLAIPGSAQAASSFANFRPHTTRAPISWRKAASPEAARPQAQRPQARKLDPARPQECIYIIKKAASSQALSRPRTGAKGRKPHHTPTSAGKPLKSNSRPLVGGVGCYSRPQIPAIWNLFVDAHNYVLTKNAKALISNAHSKTKGVSDAT